MNLNLDGWQPKGFLTGNTMDVKEKVDALLSKMSLREKVGQMTQVNLNVILEGDNFNIDGKIDQNRLRLAVSEHYVGSILNAINRAYPVEVWHEIITRIQETALNETPNRIPVLYGIDSIHGASFTLGSTLFPHNLGLAATRNPDLVKKLAQVTAIQTRASGIRWNFDPVLDIGRNPIWSRFPETFGEDVYINKIMGLAKVEGYEGAGLQSPEAVASCMKHFIGYSGSQSGKDRTPAYIPEIVLREYYMPQFKAAIDAGSSTIMINSGDVNGVPVHASKYLLSDVLRKELGFEGLVVTDWEDVIRLHTRHHVADTPVKAVKMAIDAGIDMSMVPHDFSFFAYLIELVEEGEISMERIDESVSRILTLKYKLGLFDNPFPEKQAGVQFDKPEYKELALQAARESVTLLKNEPFLSVQSRPVLPLERDNKVLITGPAANSISTLHGAWSYTWQGDNEYWYPDDTRNIVQAITEKVGKEKVLITKGKYFGRGEYYYWEMLSPDFKSLVPGYSELRRLKEEIQEKAQDASVIVLCLGEDAYAESPGVIDDLDLPEWQKEIAYTALSTDKPVVLVLSQGRPRIIRELRDKVAAIITTYQPGSMGAQALADVLYGDFNPEGKLPFTYPAHAHDFVLYDHKYADKIQELLPGTFTYEGYKPEFSFGHGLSYTSFAFGEIQLSKSILGKDEKLEVGIEVSNIGQREGGICVELYIRDAFASITPPQRRLKKFVKVFLKAGESKVVKFSLNRFDFAFVNEQLVWVTEPGEFEIMIGDQKAAFFYKE
jgi:beta-glucosidase